MATFLRKLICCSCLAGGSFSRQKACITGVTATRKRADQEPRQITPGAERNQHEADEDHRATRDYAQLR